MAINGTKPGKQLFDWQNDPDELITVENEMTSADQTFEPLAPEAVEIGFQKLAKDYKNLKE